MTKHICVFQHIDWEGPGQHLQTAALKRNAQLEVIKIWKEPIPSLSLYDALIILGGGPNVDQEDEFPFLKEEKQAVRTWLNSDRPCLGICLGHQLIAEVLGARIAPNFCRSIGFVNGHLTSKGKSHPVFKGVDHHPLLFKWHWYAVIPPVPRHFQILATSTECQVEAFSIADRPHIIGIQFDNHAAHPDDVSIWLAKDKKWLSSIPGKQINNSHILKEAKEYQEQVKRDFHSFFANFIAMI